MAKDSKKNTAIKHATIIIPTYNEAKNIIKIINKTLTLAKKQNKKISILVVDDNSPDGTHKLVKKHKNKNVHLLLRKNKEGLGAAYIAGMQHAIKKLKPDCVVEMDADFSHNPKDIFRLLKALDKGADFALGSRYVPGGSTPNNWGWHRKFVSNNANRAARIVLGIKGVNDTSGGFRAIRTEQLKKITWKNLRVKGYAFQTVLLEEIMNQGGIVKEVPIHFKDREVGTSKMRLKDYVEGFVVFARIRMKRIKEKKTNRGNNRAVQAL